MKNIDIKPGVAITFVILFIGLIISPSVFSIKVISETNITSRLVIKVDDDGDGDYIKIQDAIDNSTQGDIIEVYSGTYIDENVTVNKQLTLKGIDSELGGGTGTGKPLVIGEIDHQPEMGLITVLVDGCSVSGFYLKGKENCYCKAGIELLSENNDVFQNDFENVNFGLLMYWGVASNNRVYENNFLGTFYAVVTHTDSNEIFDNYACDNGYGIEISGINNRVYRNTVINVNDAGIKTSTNSFIFENIVINCKRGIVCYDDVNVYKNDVKECELGIWCSGEKHKIYQNNVTDCGEGITCSGSFYNDDILIFENKIDFCGTGISLGAIEKSEIYENIIYLCETGIGTSNTYKCNIYKNILNQNNNGMILQGMGFNNIYNNNFTYNTEYGLLVKNSNDNIIYHNNFIENQMNVYSDCPLLYPWQDYNIWDLGYKKDGGGNYWSDYTGNDKNNDGIGDSPYIIPDVYPNPLTNDKDRYPLMEPDSIPTCKPHTFNRLIFRLLEKFFEKIFIILK